MEYLLFAGYLFLFAWLVTKSGFFKKSGLNNPQLTILFLIKIMVGILYGWIGIYYGQFAYMYDTWGFHYAGQEETKILFSHPSEYFNNFFYSGYENKYGGFLDSENSWWNDLKSNMFIKFLSVLNILSFGNYYINVVFYSFITMIGPVSLCRVMNDVFSGKKLQVILATFLIPSFVYWTSGIHKDGLVFLAISLIIYHFYFGLKERQFPFRRIAVMILAALIIIMYRNFILIILIPAMIAWYLSVKYPGKIKLSFTLVYFLFAILFFSLRYISPALDFPQAVINKQTAFQKLQGNSSIKSIKLEPTALSFFKNSPKAVSTSVLRPYPGDVKHLLSLAAATETIFLLLLFLCFIIWRTNGIQSKAFLWFCIFFSVSFLLIIGYTVNFIGAIVRYRSIILPFLLVPAVCLTDWKRIISLISNNIKLNSNV